VVVEMQWDPVTTDKTNPSDTSQISHFSLGLKTWQDGDNEMFCCYHLWWSLMSASELAGWQEAAINQLRVSCITAPRIVQYTY
jgi:hypothetical protein